MAETNFVQPKENKDLTLVQSKESDLEEQPQQAVQAKENKDSTLVQSKESDLEEQPQQSEDSTTEPSSEFTRKDLAKLVASLVVVALTIVFSVLVFTPKHPKFKVRSVAFENLDYTTSPKPSFNMRFAAKMTVKNPNFGYFRYGVTNVSFAYRGIQVGEVLIPKARVRAVSTRKMNAAINLNSNNVRNDTNLESDIRSGTLTLTVQSNMKGKVYLMSSGKRSKVNGRKRTAALNCTLTVNLPEKLVQDIHCS
ncbi:hypothetical protein ES288_A11G218400v1 [Gossypium darwinii]|uniref:Late embryogenesis abundant protein LEA-2 subgroup domain-containing protein n=1 Tax=Gossypium darwinii TaxID=34276 RepID=A0A5D2ENT2_GOSDA|nr:hypothetical protein ES288_A11G218400v1 [Gossypium darwinii]